MANNNNDDAKQYFLYGGSYDFKNKPVHIDDIILIDDNAYIREQLLAFVREIKARKELKNYNLIATRTMFFAGAPGMGKTFAAKMLSTELQYPLYIIDIAKLMKDDGLDAVVKVMEFVRDKKNQPCILFMDECDGLARSREDKSTTSADKAGDNRITNYVMQVLQEENDDINSELIVLAATNFMDGIDEAFLNRFQIQLYFYIPNNYVPFIELEVKKNKMFKLEKDLDEETIKTVNIYANQNNFSVRALNMKINWLYKQEVIKRKEEGTLDGQVIPLKLSRVMQEIANSVKLATDIDEIMQEDKEIADSFENIVEAPKDEEQTTNNSVNFI